MELPRGNAVRALSRISVLAGMSGQGFRHFGLALAGLKPSGAHAGADVLVDDGGVPGHSISPPVSRDYILS